MVNSLSAANKYRIRVTSVGGVPTFYRPQERKSFFFYFWVDMWCVEYIDVQRLCSREQAEECIDAAIAYNKREEQRKITRSKDNAAKKISIEYVKYP